MSDANYPSIENYPNGTDWNMEITPRPLYEMLDETAAEFSDNLAFDFLGKTWKWGEIKEQVDDFAAALQHKLDVKKGTKVGIFLPNSPYYLVAFYAILKAGGTVVNFNPLYAERELSHQIEDSEVDFMVTLDLDMLYEKMQAMLNGSRLKKIIVCKFTDILPFPKNLLFPLVKRGDMAKIKSFRRKFWYHELLDDVKSNNLKAESVEIDPVEDVAVLQYTGGTTGVPKGAMLTHQNLHANAVQCQAWFPDDLKRGEGRMLGVLPFFHVFAMTTILNVSVINGYQIIAMPRFELKDALKTIVRTKPHLFPAVPAIYNAINNFKGLDKFDLSSLKFCVSGGAPLPVEVKKEFEKITGCIVVEGYGLTESSPVASANPFVGENVPGSIGLPFPQTVIEIIDPEDKKTPVPTGERGELCIRGPQVMKGYYNKQEATDETIIDGRLHTGDIAIIDEKGYVYIVDRIKDMIITNGYNVYPRNIEEVIYLHPSVEECIVAGLPDENRGEIVKAWIKLKEGRELSVEDLRAFLDDKLGKMEMPKRIEFRDEPLPKTMIGKLSRKDILAEELGEKE
ncbi:MAG: long-chain fatty acid--CoA ligase [Pseudomonadota bacterium]